MRTPRKFILLGLTVLATACSSAPVRLPSHAQSIYLNGDGRIGAYVSKPRGFETVSYWIEGPEGLILIDTQFLLSAAQEALDWAETTTGKKVVLAIVLHPNPDKFNGTALYQKRGIKVVTSEQVAKLIPEVHKDRHHWFYDRYKPDYPNEEARPESFGDRTTVLAAGGVSVKAHVLGAGASGAHVVVEFDGHLFVGDLVANGGHSWLELGRTDEWLEVLTYLQELEPDYVHPGRGFPGGSELLDRQELYLEKVVELVRAERPKMPVNQLALARVQEKMERLYPGYGYEYFLEVGLPAIWETQANRRPKK